MRILVTGGRTGYLGRHVVSTAGRAGHKVLAVSSVDADLREERAVRELLVGARPEVVIHTAYRHADWDSTAIAAAQVAKAAARIGARVVFVSSDVVFSGAASSYDESARPDPITPYGAAKAAAEVAVGVLHDDVVTARTSLILGDGHSTHERLVHDMLGSGQGALFDDELRCAVHVADLAAALVELASHQHRGVIHLGGADAMTRLELGRLIAHRDGMDPGVLVGCRRADLAIPGPVELRLDSSLARALLATRLRGARESLGKPYDG